MLREMDDGFRVCLWVEGCAFTDEFIFEFDEIFHDTIMDNHDFPRVAHVRMRVARGRRTMSRPARVTNSRRTADRFFRDEINQLSEFARVAPQVNMIAIDNRNARRVVAAIFKALQAIQDDRRRVTRSDVSNDSTHKRVPPVIYDFRFTIGDYVLNRKIL